MNQVFIKSSDKNNSTKREFLFTIQSIIVTGLLTFTAIAFFFYNNLEIEKGIKVVFAPFLSVVPLLFILSILRDIKQGFTEGDYSKNQIIKFCITAFGITLLFTGVTFLLSKIEALEILLAALMAVLSVVFFLKIKIKDILGMSIITGITEGIIIYMIFLF
jgi:succinate dehydrogenase hydrophobic anchor subunit